MEIAFCLSVAVPLYKIALSQYCFPALLLQQFLSSSCCFHCPFLHNGMCVSLFFPLLFNTTARSTFKILNMILLHPCLKSFGGILLFLEQDPLGFVFAIKTQNGVTSVYLFNHDFKHCPRVLGSQCLRVFVCVFIYI